jgi:ABC-2 type transport system permease protein
LLQLDGWSINVLTDNLKIYFITTALVVLLNTPIAFFAIWGRGYLTPLGIVALLLVFAQIAGAMGLGNYFPWSVPGIYSGSGGEELKLQLNALSFTVIIITGIAGYFGTVFWWKYSDQK